MADDKICRGCGQLEGIKEYDEKLWELYHRLKDGGRKYIEPLVYTQGDLEELGFYDDDPDDPYSTHQAVMASMEKNMVERGLCGECGRPNLAGKTADDFMTQEEADSLADMYAEMAAERRAGC